MGRLLAFLQRRANDVAVALLTVMFASFVIQIVSRYVLDAPVGWSVEVCLTAWLWVVFWDAAFGLSDRDHVKFDIVYHAAGRRAKQVLAAISALAIVVGLLASMPATYGFISFYQIKTSATLHLRLDYVFAVYGIFAIATVLRYLWRILRILRGRDPDGAEPDRLSPVEAAERPRP